MKKWFTICVICLAWLSIAGCDGSADSDTSCKDGDIRCKSADTPYLAQVCMDSAWKDVDLSQVADIEASVCVVVGGKAFEKPECPGDTEGAHATILPWIAPVCAVAECVKDERGVLFTAQYSKQCKRGGTITGNTCDCGTED